MTMSRGVGKKKWAIAALAVAAVALLAIYEVLLGRLFPFSPLVVGFSRQEYGNYVVYHHGQPESSQLSYLSEVVAVEEKYHGMRFRSKPKIFLCRDVVESRTLNVERSFEEVYGTKFGDEIARFKNELVSHPRSRNSEGGRRGVATTWDPRRAV